MNNLMVFEGNSVEVFEHEGKILFNPYHVGECLGLNNITVRRHMQEMSEKQVIKLRNLDVQDMNIRKLNNAGENFLTESGVYKLIFKSRKENAEKFQDWIADEVLPQIRKTGAYISDKADPETLRKKADELESLSTVNKSLEILTPILDSLGIDEKIKLLTAKTLFNKAGVDIPVQIIEEELYYDTKQIASMIGIASKAGNPAYNAVNEIIRKIDVEASERKAVWESKGNWQGTVTKYTKSVADKVEKWLRENDFPVAIKGNNRTFHIVYKYKIDRNIAVS